jgi:hypothetical protein
MTVGLSARSAAAATMTVLLAACANDVMTTRPPDLAAGGSAGASSAGAAAMAGAIVAGGAGSPAGLGGTSGGVSGAATGGEPGAGTAGSNGGMGQGGTSGSAGSAGSSGSGGSAGSSGGGTGGTGGNDAEGEILSISKNANSDSEETDNGNLIANGNDGSVGTRWCAADGGLGHWWTVDLAQSYTLTQIQIVWEQAVAYQYLIERSDDASVWSPLIDNTASTDTTQLQTLPIDGAPGARHVRITVTGLPAGSWASFFEFRVYGY